MSKSSFLATCKDCGAFFGTSSLGNLSSQILGRGESSRCPKHRKTYKRNLSSMGLGYLEALLRRDLPLILPAPEGGLGTINPDRPQREEIQFPGVPGAEETQKFASAKPIMDDLVAELLNPQGARVVMLRLPTGFGKSVYMPYSLLVSKLSSLGTIWVTEPRLSVLKPEKVNGPGTIPWYIGTHLLRAPAPGYGKGFEIGVRYADDGQQMYDPDNNRLIFCSDGLLLRVLLGGGLDGVKVLVIDEAHEMTENMSTLYTLLRRALVLYPELRIVFASATVDPQAWVDFYPQGVRVIAPEGADIKHQAQITINWPFMEDRNHDPLEGYVETFGYSEQFSEFKEVVQAGDIPDIAAKIVKGVRQGSIGSLGDPYADCLIFVPVTSLIRSTKAAIERLALPGVKIFGAHRNMSSQERSAFEESERKVATGQWPSDQQRIVIGTNIFETGVTYRFKYIIEPGLFLEITWNSRLATYEYQKVRATQDKMRQRWGRVGRLAAGEVICCYSKSSYLAQPPYAPPALTQSSLDNVLLSLLRTGLATIDNVEIFGVNLNDPTMAEEYARATRQLQLTGAIDEKGRLTNRGALMEGGVGLVNLGNMILCGEDFGYAVEMATFLAFVLRGESSLFQESDKGLLAQFRWSAGCLDDLEFYLKLYHFWLETSEAESAGTRRRAKRKKEMLREQWSLSEGLESSTFRAITANRDRLLKQFERGTHESQSARDFDFQRIHRVRAAIALSMPEWVFVRNSDGAYEPAFPDRCPIQGELRIDRESSCVIANDVDAFVCIERIAKGEVVYASHIVRIEREWIPFLLGQKELVLLKMVKSAMQKASVFTSDVDKRLTAPPEAEVNLRLYTAGQELKFQVLAIQTRRAGSGQWLLVRDLGTNQIVGVRMNFCSLEIGDTARAIVKRIDVQESCLEVWTVPLMQDLVKAGKEVRGVVVEIRANQDDESLIKEILVQIEPGIRGTLTTAKLFDFEAAAYSLGIGDEVPVLPASVSEGGRLYVSLPLVVEEHEEWITALLQQTQDPSLPDVLWICPYSSPLVTHGIFVFQVLRTIGLKRADGWVNFCVGYIKSSVQPSYGALFVAKLDVATEVGDSVPVIVQQPIGLVRVLSKRQAAKQFFQSSSLGTLYPEEIVVGEGGVVEAVEFELQHGFRAKLNRSRLDMFADELDGIYNNTAFSNLYVSKSDRQGNLLLDPVVPSDFTNQHVRARLLKILNEESPRPHLLLQLAPGINGIVTSDNGAAQLLYECRERARKYVDVYVISKEEYRGQMRYELAHPLWTQEPTVGHSYLGIVTNTKEFGQFVHFFPGARPGLYRDQVRAEGSAIVVRLTQIGSDRSGRTTYELVESSTYLEIGVSPYEWHLA